MHYSQRLRFRCFTKAKMFASRNSSQHSNLRAVLYDRPHFLRQLVIWKIAAHTRTRHKFRTADAAANERTDCGVGTNFMEK